MVSAVFHSPLAAASESIAMKTEAQHVDSARAMGTKDHQTLAPSVANTKTPAVARPHRDWRGLVMAVLPPLLGLGLLVCIWAIVSISTASKMKMMAAFMNGLPCSRLALLQQPPPRRLRLTRRTCRRYSLAVRAPERLAGLTVRGAPST